MNLSTYQRLAERTEKTPPVNERGMVEITVQQYRLLHAALGALTEAGELADNIKRHVIYGKELDTANIGEESGDLLWYLACAHNATGQHMVLSASGNISKLMQRYPDKYTDEHALARADKAGGA